MTFQKRWLRHTLLMTILAMLATGLLAQDSDDGGSLVAEDLILDDLLSGDLKPEKKLDVAADPQGDMEQAATNDELLTDAESILATNGTAPADASSPAQESTVEDLAADVLGNDAVTQTSDIPMVAEPVDEAQVMDEPVVQETPQDDLLAGLLDEQPATDLATPAEDSATDSEMVVEEEKGAATPGVDDLAREALGDAAIDQPATDTGMLNETATEAAPAATQDDLLSELGLEPAAEETVAAPAVEETAAREPVAAEEQMAEQPADEAAPAATQDDLLSELGLAPAAEAPAEPAVEAPAAEEPMTAPAVEETVVPEEPIVAQPVEEPVIPAAPAMAEPASVSMPQTAEPATSPAQMEQPPAMQPVATPVAVQPPQPDPVPPSVTIMMETEALKRKAFKNHAAQTLETAERALRDRQYQKARTLFESTIDTLERLGRRPEDQKLRMRAREGLGETLYRWALVFRKEKDLEAASQMARSASLAGHPRAPKLVGEIEQEKINPPPPPPPEEIARWDQKEFREEETDIAKRLKDGRQFYMTAEYDQAEAKFKGILRIDPFNTEAIRMLEKTARKKSEVATMELDATRESMLAELRKSWNPRDYGIEDEKKTELTGENEPKPGDQSQSDRVRILKKMEAINVPEIEFRQANIHDVINFLQGASREFDTEDVDSARKGVNIILNLQAGESEPAMAPAVTDPFATPSAEAAPATAGVPLITFSARHISLLEALKIVTKVANLKYRIEGTVVMILPWDAPIGEITVRMYDVLPSVEERISAVSAQLDTGGGMGGFGRSTSGGGFGSIERAPSTSGEGVDWKTAFNDMGVQWPKGSSIKYVRAMGKLVVANTADNLTTFEQILSELNVVPSQIEIEARFVEVGQTDLDSLGFEWLLNDNWEVAQRSGQQNTALSGRQRIVVQENASSGGFTTGNRFLQGGSGLTGTAVADNIMTIAGVLTNPELALVLHALQQRGSTDLLSAPKVLTQSGVEASIKVVTEYVYPTDFQVTPITASAAGGSGNSQIVGGVVEPSGFETREVGVILTVTPEVSPEGQMIDLTMMPEVVSDPIWKNYGTTYTDENGNTQQLPMEQPFFFTRSISSTISIYNGATVVMGGMITETRTEVNDQIPLLGDIPLLGRLFRSSYEQSEKRNLLIFVTARLVDPAGRPL